MAGSDLFGNWDYSNYIGTEPEGRWVAKLTTAYDLDALVERVNRLTRDSESLYELNNLLRQRIVKLEQATGLNAKEFKPRVEALRSEDV